MYKMVPWSKELDLTSFYDQALQRGYKNNSSKEVLIDCFNHEIRWKVWILYKNNDPVGSVASHSLDIFGPNAYRICARTCALVGATRSSGLGTLKKSIIEHQNLNDQFFIPACIEWAGVDKELYISTHPSTVGSQRLVHKTYCPTLEKIGILSNEGEYFYRGHMQTFWKLNIQKFYENLNKYPLW